MSQSSQAVFLSYASQDAAAAKGIADALSAAGVEVWFDQSELRGGDAWDAKIRRQIKECALFVPVISASTNARPEGYFRLEWKLAVDRSHLLADDHPFLFPVVIGDVSDASARVPDKFREVQWTRLRLDETPSELAGRVVRLLGGAVAPETPERRSRGAGGPASRRQSGWIRTAWTIVGLSFAVLYLLKPLWRAPGTKETRAPVETAAPSANALEAQKLERQARALIDDDPLAVRENFLTAKRLGERAIDLDPSNAEAYAVTARAWCVLISDYRDSSPASVAAARSRAESAIRLAPDSMEAALALASVDLLARSRPAELEQRLASLLQRVPDDRRILRLLQRLATSQSHAEEVQKWVDRAIALPGGDPESLNNRVNLYWALNEYPQMAVTLEQSLAQRTTALACHFKLMLLVWGWGDLPAGRAWVEQMPASLLQEDRVAMLAYLTWYWSRQPDRALEVLQRFPRPFIEQGALFVSTDFLAGNAQLLAGHAEVAKVAFAAGLKAVNERLTAEPNNPRYLFEKTRLLARLGQRAETDQSLRIYRELAGPDAGLLQVAEVLVVTGANDEAIAAAGRSIDRSRSRWPVAVNHLRYDPVFDPLRADPRFQAIIAKGEAQLAELRAGGTHALTAAAVPATDDKSIAVLAFANLSDDKANEYFSDGITEELLNVLAKVPGLKVTARTSSFFFKGKDVPIPEIAQKLGVAYVVEGSVRKAGDKVRITAQLIKAADGFHVWSDTFTRDLKDVFAVQDEIAGLIAKQLSLEMGMRRGMSTAAVNPQAFELYVQARQAWNLRTLEGFDQAEELLNRALAIEPNFARAHAALANVWTLRDTVNHTLGTFNERNSPEVGRIQAAIDRALALEPDLDEAHVAQGSLDNATWRTADALRSLRRAIELNPGDATAHQFLGRALIVDGRLDEAEAELKRAAELDPMSHRILDNYSIVLRLVGRPAEALVMDDRALALQPNSRQAMVWRAADLSALGRHAEALEQIRRVPHDISYGHFIAQVFMAAGQKAEAEAAVALPGTERAYGLAVLGRWDEALKEFEATNLSIANGGLAVVSPLFDPLRSDPRFLRALERMGLSEAHARAQAWRAAHQQGKANVMP